LLGLYNIRTVVIERDASFYHLPRAIVLDDEIMRIFQYIGLIDEVLPFTWAITGEQFLNSKREVLFTATLASYHTGYASSNAFYQPEIEAVLRRGVERFPCVQVFHGHEVTELHQDEQGVVVTMQSLASHEQLQFQAHYLLGCDGARSITRQTAGIPLQDLKFHQAWLVIDALLKDDATGLQSQFVQQYCHPIRPETYVPSVHKHRRWEFMLLAGESQEDMLQPEKIQTLLASWTDPGNLEIIRAAVYTFHALIAQQWHQGRLFLLGDAAHQMPPFSGQGMCTGIRDAYNLCWKLALVLRGQAQPALLDSYQQERAQLTRLVITIAVLMGQLIQAPQPLATLRDSIISLLARLHPFSLRMPPLTSGLLMQTPAITRNWRRHDAYLLALANGLLKQTHAQGAPLPQPVVHTSTGSSLPLDDTLGPGFAVLGLNVDPRASLASSALAFWDSLPTRFIQVISSAHSHKPQPDAATQQTTCIEDSQGLLTTWFAQQPGQIAIVRPDRYIFGICTPQTLPTATNQLQKLLL
jgi:2-polyprenyl-6-methoxyphenol hydroxylase-like FAD-dependent oxidoreductase